MLKVLFWQFEGSPEARILHYADWQRYRYRTCNHQRWRVISSLQNRFSVWKDLFVHKPVVNDNLAEEPVARVISCTGKVSVSSWSIVYCGDRGTQLDAGRSQGLAWIFLKNTCFSSIIIIAYWRASNSGSVGHCPMFLELMKPAP